ncbi:hypothetical protein [Rivularia sp. UHCC 0363]|uniref:hypothetical protein n=1 Tax=Rivularia sp. UHCC 0363 TaxID=3110244 RepID=UPI002B21AEE4|nr:hypothetical protein [Rivularia sp. UHCC 0363]MEA5594909.1 hypothetical protein [Rivularia sp. UHCC 0363]
MKSHNAELLANLKSFTQGLVFSDDERGSLKPFIWDVSQRGELYVLVNTQDGDWAGVLIDVKLNR